MKNKKILSRIFALCSVAVLLFALALPCFADIRDDRQVLSAFETYVTSINPDAINPCYNALIQRGVNPLDYLYMVSGKLSTDNFLSHPIFNYVAPDSYTYIRCKAAIYDSTSLGAFLVEPNGIFVCELEIDTARQDPLISFYDDQTGIMLVLEYRDRGNGYFLNSVGYADGSLDNVDNLSVVLFFDDNIEYQLMNGLANTMYVQETLPNCFSITDFLGGYSNGRTDSVVPPANTGLYGQLYYILSDAIYGENVVLGSTQDFALTLVTTLLVLCVVLLPVLLVVAIMFKLFRW